MAHSHGINQLRGKIQHDLQDIDNVVGEEGPTLEDRIVTLQYEFMFFSLGKGESGEQMIVTERDMAEYRNLQSILSRATSPYASLYPVDKWSEAPNKRQIFRELDKLQHSHTAGIVHSLGLIYPLTSKPRLFKDLDQGATMSEEQLTLALEYREMVRAGTLELPRCLLKVLVVEPPKSQYPPPQEHETTATPSSKKNKRRPKNPAAPLEFMPKLQKASSTRKPLLYDDEEPSNTFGQAKGRRMASMRPNIDHLVDWYVRARQEDLNGCQRFLEDNLE